MFMFSRQGLFIRTITHFFKWANPDLNGLFKQTSLQFLQQINVKNVISIQYTALGFILTTS